MGRLESITKAAAYQVFQLPSAERWLLHQHRVCKHIQGDLNIGQHRLQRAAVTATAHATQSRLHIF